MNCTGCGCALSLRNTTGFCRACNGRAVIASFSNMPRQNVLRDLIDHALVLADNLQSEGKPRSADIVLELAKRAAPQKQTGRKSSNFSERTEETLPAAELATPSGIRVLRWCEQCERRVAQSCTSRFCKVAA
jgi:hypothetical protein